MIPAAQAAQKVMLMNDVSLPSRQPDASHHDLADKQAGWSRANERKRIAAGGRRIPGGVLSAEAADALATLHNAGYAPTLTACIARALVDAAALKR